VRIAGVAGNTEDGHFSTAPSSKKLVDYKIMETISVNDNVSVLDEGFQWSDLGSWEEIQSAIDDGRISPAFWQKEIAVKII